MYVQLYICNMYMKDKHLFSIELCFFFFSLFYLEITVHIIFVMELRMSKINNVTIFVI
jgi:hypothetical protein